MSWYCIVGSVSPNLTLEMKQCSLSHRKLPVGIILQAADYFLSFRFLYFTCFNCWKMLNMADFELDWQWMYNNADLLGSLWLFLFFGDLSVLMPGLLFPQVPMFHWNKFSLKHSLLKHHHSTQGLLLLKNIVVKSYTRSFSSFPES